MGANRPDQADTGLKQAAESVRGCQTSGCTHCSGCKSNDHVVVPLSSLEEVGKHGPRSLFPFPCSGECGDVTLVSSQDKEEMVTGCSVNISVYTPVAGTDL